jgi:galactokinase
MLQHVLVNKKLYTGISLTCIVCVGSIEVKKGVSPPWYSYFLCGLKGVLEVLQQVSVGMLVAVTGSVPQSSGLSSSSALVSAAALAAAHANNVCTSHSTSLDTNSYSFPLYS